MTNTHIIAKKTQNPKEIKITKMFKPSCILIFKDGISMNIFCRNQSKVRTRRCGHG